MTSPPDDTPPAATGGVSPPIEQFTSMRQALQDALEHTPHLRRDRAAIALAFRYADLIDDATDRMAESDDEDQARDFARMVAVIDKIGGRLLVTLERMGMAPGARAATRDGDPQGGGAHVHNPAVAALAALERAHTAAASGVDYTAHVDPSVTAADAGD